jgi:hypothetical protein
VFSNLISIFFSYTLFFHIPLRYNLEVTHIVGDPAVWRTLRSLKLESYRCMLVISDERELGDLMASDSHNLACILLLRHHVELAAVEKSRNAESSTGYNLTHPIPFTLHVFMC